MAAVNTWFTENNVSTKVITPAGDWLAFSIPVSKASTLFEADFSVFKYVATGREIVRTLALSLLVLGLWSLIGLGIGILIPNQVAALLISVGVLWIVEPLGTIALGFWEWGREHVSPYLPQAATNAIVNGVTQQTPNAAEQLSWWGGAITLVVYAVVLAGSGVWRTVRADIT